MLTHPTLDTLRALKLDGMAEAFTELQTQDGSADLTHAEWLGRLIDREAISRETKCLRAACASRLRHIGAAPEDVDYKTRKGWIRRCSKACSAANGSKTSATCDHTLPAKPGWPRWPKRRAAGVTVLLNAPRDCLTSWIGPR